MIWLIIYLIIGIILSIIYTKRLQLNDPEEIDTDELIAFAIVCVIFWPYIVIMDMIF